MLDKSFKLSEKSLEVITRFLGLSNLHEIMERRFQDFSPEDDIIRDKVDKYSRRIRGSVRLRSGRYYTAQEFQDRIERIKHLELP